jgi:hypothetical protein
VSAQELRPELTRLYERTAEQAYEFVLSAGLEGALRLMPGFAGRTARHPEEAIRVRAWRDGLFDGIAELKAREEAVRQ